MLRTVRRRNNGGDVPIAASMWKDRGVATSSNAGAKLSSSTNMVNFTSIASAKLIVLIVCQGGADGIVERYKARFIAKEFTQTYGVDYHDTFALVAKMNIVRVQLSLAINLDWTLRQFDVKNAFLHGELEEQVYMNLPPGYGVTGNTGNVCILKKALYGLKQSPQAWFGRFTAATKKFGYQQANTDHTLFIKHKAGKVTLLIIYVDDMIVTSDDTVEIEELQKRQHLNLR